MEEDGQAWQRPSRTRWHLWTDSANRGTLYSAAILALIAIPVPAPAAELPDDVWSGKYGGFPSITADADGNVSMEVPAQAVEEAGGGSVAQFAKNFLEKWASGTCFGVFDFQAPDKNLKVKMALLSFLRKSSHHKYAARTLYSIRLYHGLSLIMIQKLVQSAPSLSKLRLNIT